MSAKSSFLRGVYGVEKRPRIARSKYAFYRQQRAERGDILRRAADNYMKHKTQALRVVAELRREMLEAEWALKGNEN